MEIATYQATPEKHGNGTFFFTDCGYRMYSVKDEMAYHGCYCPACLNKGVYRVLIFVAAKKQMNIGIRN